MNITEPPETSDSLSAGGKKFVHITGYVFIKNFSSPKMKLQDDIIQKLDGNSPRFILDFHSDQKQMLLLSWRSDCRPVFFIVST